MAAIASSGAEVSEAKVAASVAHLEELLTVSLEQPMRIELELHLTPPTGMKRRPIQRSWQGNGEPQGSREQR